MQSEFYNKEGWPFDMTPKIEEREDAVGLAVVVFWKRNTFYNSRHLWIRSAISLHRVARSNGSQSAAFLSDIAFKRAEMCHTFTPKIVNENWKNGIPDHLLPASERVA